MFPVGRDGSHEGLPRTLKRLANGVLVKFGGLITHQVDRRHYRNHRKQAQNHISLGSRQRLLGESYGALCKVHVNAERKRTVDNKASKAGHTWKEIEKLAPNRRRWQTVSMDLCSTGSD